MGGEEVAERVEVPGLEEAAWQWDAIGEHPALCSRAADHGATDESGNGARGFPPLAEGSWETATSREVGSWMSPGNGP